MLAELRELFVAFQVNSTERYITDLRSHVAETATQKGLVSTQLRAKCLYLLLGSLLDPNVRTPNGP